jgi:hypothetical protein
MVFHICYLYIYPVGDLTTSPGTEKYLLLLNSSVKTLLLVFIFLKFATDHLCGIELTVLWVEFAFAIRVAYRQQGSEF